MLQPPKDKKKKANGSSSYGQISSSQEQRAQKTNTAAKNFLNKAVDVVKSSGRGWEYVGKSAKEAVLGAVKNRASSGTSNQEIAKEAVLGASPSIRSKGKEQPRPSKRLSGHVRPKTKTKSSQPSRPDGMPMMGKPKEGISMRIKSRLGLGQ